MLQTICLRVQQLTLYLGRLQAAACGEQSCCFPCQLPGQGLEAAQATGMEQEKRSQHLAELLHRGRGKVQRWGWGTEGWRSPGK